jgi:hypothetical protein
VGVEALAEQRLRSAAIVENGYEEDDDGGEMGESASLFALYPSTVNPSSHLSHLSRRWNDGIDLAFHMSAPRELRPPLRTRIEEMRRVFLTRRGGRAVK